MGPSVDQEIARISARIRQWREEAGLTLQELARRGGLATSTVQKVETGQMTPSVAVLLKLSHGLGRRPAELISDGDVATTVSLGRASDRVRTGQEGTLRVERLSGDLEDPSLEMWRVVLPPGASSGRAPIHYDGEELVVCERGSVRFCIGGADHVLEPGDCLHFKAHLPHRFESAGSEETWFTVTGTLPGRLRALIPLKAAGSAEGEEREKSAKAEPGS